jgi:hypothetical protein
MTTFVPHARRIVAAGLLVAASTSAQGSATSAQSSTKSTQGSAKSAQGSTKSTQGSTKSAQGSAKSAQGAAKSAPAKAMQTRVWVNTDSKVYHCPESIYYGKTRNGEFMEEAQARGYGNRAAESQGCKNVVTTAPAPLPFATNAARRMVWVNTESGIYHCPNTSDWGATRRGRYLTESDASASGHKPAAGKACGAR